MQPESSPSQQSAVVGQVLDLIRLLRLAYSPAMIGAQASVQVQHALDVLGGEVERLGDVEGRPVTRRLALVPNEAVASGGSGLASETATAPSAGEASRMVAAMAPPADEGSPTTSAATATDNPDAQASELPDALDVSRATDTTDGAPLSTTPPQRAEPSADSAADALLRGPHPAAAPPDLGNEPREDVGRAFRSALMADLTRRSMRPASTPPAPRTGPHETTTCPASDASASTTPVRTAMPAS